MGGSVAAPSKCSRLKTAQGGTATRARIGGAMRGETTGPRLSWKRLHKVHSGGLGDAGVVVVVVMVV